MASLKVVGTTKATRRQEQFIENQQRVAAYCRVSKNTEEQKQVIILKYYKLGTN